MSAWDVCRHGEYPDRCIDCAVATAPWKSAPVRLPIVVAFLAVCAAAMVTFALLGSLAGVGS